MSADDIQTIINLFGIVAVVMLVWILVKILKDEKSDIVEDDDWVIDFCAGKPYKKTIKGKK